MRRKLNQVIRPKSRRANNAKQRAQWEAVDCLLNLVYQEHVEPMTQVPWYHLSTDHLIEWLLKYNINPDFIKKIYLEDLKRMARKREEIEIFTFSKPQS